MVLPEIDLKHYTYQLPDDRIAQYPLPHRDQSKLLVYNQGQILHRQFHQITDHLPKGCTLVFNDTKVIPARLEFQKPTGATIEVFLLDPVTPSSDINLAMLVTESCNWSCMIGNLKRWKKHQSLQKQILVNGSEIVLTARLQAPNQVHLSWDNSEITFVEIIKNAGQVPLPPYMKRKAETEDQRRYQTVYSRIDGAVAAPTAGLHFTDPILNLLDKQGIKKEYLTLHVGAGTFQPVKESNVADHPMHGEQLSVTLQNVNNLLKSENLIAVGTTSLRTLESLYWYGVKLQNRRGDDFHIGKLDPYLEYPKIPSFKESLLAVQSHMESQQLTRINGYTEIFIFPPYQVRSCIGLITNFHLPASTLILLVASFMGEDWKKVYQQALRHDYRFLSYGDSSLLLPSIQDKVIDKSV